MKHLTNRLNPSLENDPLRRRDLEDIKSDIRELMHALGGIITPTNNPTVGDEVVIPALDGYLKLAGRDGGQIAHGGTQPNDVLRLKATTDTTVGGTVQIYDTAGLAGTNNVFEIRSADGTLRSRVAAPFHEWYIPNLTVGSTDDTGQRTNLTASTLWFYDSGGNTDGFITSTSDLQIRADNSSGITMGGISVGTSIFRMIPDPAAGSYFDLSGNGVDNFPTLLVRLAKTGGTSDIQQWATLSSTVLSRIQADGTFSGPIATTSAVTVTDSTFRIQDDGNNARKLAFELGGLSAVTRTLTVPDASGTIATLENAHTVTGAWVLGDGSTTITAATIAASIYDGQGFVFRDVAAGFNAQISPGGAGGLTANRLYMFPDATGTVVLSGVSATLTGNTNSTFKISTASSGTAFEDNTTANKRLRFITSTCSASTNSVLRFNSTASRTIDLFDASDTVVGRATTDTLTNKTLTSTNVLRFNSAGTQVVMQDSTTTTKQLNFDLTSLTASTTSNVVFVGGAARTWTVPNHDMTFVGRVGSDDKTGQTGAIANVTLYTPTQAGRFRLTAYAVFTAVTAPGALEFRATWTDPQATNTDFALPAIDASGTYLNPVPIAAAGNFAAWSFELYSTASAIQYDTTWTGTGTYNIYVRLEAL